MKLGDFSSVGIQMLLKSFDREIDEATRKLTTADLYWYIDDFTWMPIRRSVFPLHQSIQQQHEVRQTT
jgi:hypothetical protein